MYSRIPEHMSRLLRFRKETRREEEGDCQAPLEAGGNQPLPNGHITRRPNVGRAFISY